MFDMMLQGKITIDQVHEQYNRRYPKANNKTKIMLKCWKYYAESRNNNNHYPITFEDYMYHMRGGDYIDFIKIGIIDVSDLTAEEIARVIELFGG